ncbi:MAG: hypothetical protein Q8M92_06215, partial [Candidatus Subteraquimicrobiales bacterium]|nr:hypothetical protein [Candidatus Subteraquimicrobiales bacterium]
ARQPGQDKDDAAELEQELLDYTKYGTEETLGTVALANNIYSDIVNLDYRVSYDQGYLTLSNYTNTNIGAGYTITIFHKNNVGDRLGIPIRFLVTGVKSYGDGTYYAIPLGIHKDIKLIADSDNYYFGMSFYDLTGYTISGDGVDRSRGYALYYSSIAYRKSLHGVKNILGVETLRSMFGDNSLVNPISNLGCGAFLAGAAAGFANSFKVCCVDLRDVADLSEKTPHELLHNLPLWMTAIKEVDKYKDAYFINTLTNNNEIQDAWIQYINTSSDVSKSKAKLYYLPRAIVNMGDDEQEVGGRILMQEAFGNALYGENDYSPGRHYSDGYENLGIVSFDKDADVEVAQSYPMPYNNERLIFIGCEFAEVNGINIEGYYVAAIIAGWRSNLPVGYVADGMQIPLLSNIPSNNGYYSEEDLDALSSSGWYMLHQGAPNTPVTCYIQRTTAYDHDTKCEEDIVVS